MDKKRFLEVFSRYNPDKDKRALLESAIDASFKLQRQPLVIVVDLTFDRHYDAEIIYEIEDECRGLYKAESFKIYPHFPPETFDLSRFDEITLEAAMIGAVTHGFFGNANYSDDGATIRVEIPIFEQGVAFVKNANTEKLLSDILLSRYGISRNLIYQGKLPRGDDV